MTVAVTPPVVLLLVVVVALALLAVYALGFHEGRLREREGPAAGPRRRGR